MKDVLVSENGFYHVLFSFSLL